MTIYYHQELKGLPKILGFCMDIKSLLVGKSFPMQNFPNQGKILPWGKLPWSWKNICFWSNSLFKKKSLLAENVPNQGNIFAFGKFPWSRKRLCLWKNFSLWKTYWSKKIHGLCKISLIKEKPLCENSMIMEK